MDDESKSQIPKNIVLPKAVRGSWGFNWDFGWGHPFFIITRNGAVEHFKSFALQYAGKGMASGNFAVAFCTAAVWGGCSLVWLRLLFSVYVLPKMQEGACD